MGNQHTKFVNNIDKPVILHILTNDDLGNFQNINKLNLQPNEMSEITYGNLVGINGVGLNYSQCNKNPAMSKKPTCKKYEIVYQNEISDNTVTKWDFQCENNLVFHSDGKGCNYW